MRDIKFRLIKDGKVVGYERHIVDPLFDKNGRVMLEYSHDNKEWHPNNIGTIRHDHKSQFIGLKVKDGTEIYEGDIIENDDYIWLIEPIGSLERDGNNYGLCASPRGNGENYFIDDSVLNGVVIGNIDENPELLGKS